MPIPEILIITTFSTVREKIYKRLFQHSERKVGSLAGSWRYKVKIKIAKFLACFSVFLKDSVLDFWPTSSLRCFLDFCHIYHQGKKTAYQTRMHWRVVKF